MIFTELRFLAFFATVFAVYWALGESRARKAWLLVMSFAFYAAWDWRFLSLIVISILVDYAVGLGLERTDRSDRSNSSRRRRALLLTSLGVNLGMLGFFKYFGFFVDSAVDLGEILGFAISRPALEVVLPVGISFYTFQTLSYSIDVYRRKIPATRNLLDLALFVAFFPQLVAGPIVRAASFLPQLKRPAVWSEVQVSPLLTLFLLGFLKKACISDNISPIVDAYFSSPESYTAAGAWIAVLLYAIQIYCDFSGYSDMAIASAGLLGFDLGANFRHPYVAANPRQFWQRWHISLSTWLRDYLYIPLGGNRHGPRRTAIHLMLTMLLGGLWHGAAWSFVLWGGLHGAALVVHRGWTRWRQRLDSAAPSPVWTGLLALLATQYWVCFAWIFFRAQDLSSALVAARSFVLFQSPGELEFDPRWWLLIVSFAFCHWLFANRVNLSDTVRLPTTGFAVAYGGAIAVVLLFVSLEVQPFIYFQF